MNKLKIFALMLITACFAACSEDGKDVSDNSVKVVATDTTEIPALGGKGSVTVDKPVTSAYAKDSWLNVTTDGQTVSFSADKYTERESRLTELVIKAAADDSTIVSVKQYGYIFNAESVKSLEVSFSASQKLIPITSTEKVKVTSSPEWITASVTDEGILLKIAANTGAERTGTVKFANESVSTYTGSVTVTQGAADPLSGNYILGGTDADGQFVTTPCKITRDGLVLSSLGVTIPATWDESTYTLTMKNGTYLGIIGQYHGYFMCISANGKITVDPSPTATFKLAFDESVGGYYAELGGSWGTDKTVGFMFGAFSSQSFEEASYLGKLLELNPVAIMSNSESSSTTASKRSLMKSTSRKANSVITGLRLSPAKLDITKLNLTK